MLVLNTRLPTGAGPATQNNKSLKRRICEKLSKTQMCEQIRSVNGVRKEYSVSIKDMIKILTELHTEKRLTLNPVIISHLNLRLKLEGDLNILLDNNHSVIDIVKDMRTSLEDLLSALEAIRIDVYDFLITPKSVEKLNQLINQVKLDIYHKSIFRKEVQKILSQDLNPKDAFDRLGKFSSFNFLKISLEQVLLVLLSELTDMLVMQAQQRGTGPNFQKLRELIGYIQIRRRTINEVNVAEQQIQ